MDLRDLVFQTVFYRMPAFKDALHKENPSMGIQSVQKVSSHVPRKTEAFIKEDTRKETLYIGQ